VEDDPPIVSVIVRTIAIVSPGVEDSKYTSLAGEVIVIVTIERYQDLKIALIVRRWLGHEDLMS
jgi:hypothetical protein